MISGLIACSGGFAAVAGYHIICRFNPAFLPFKIDSGQIIECCLLLVVL